MSLTLRLENPARRRPVGLIPVLTGAVVTGIAAPGLARALGLPAVEFAGMALLLYLLPALVVLRPSSPLAADTGFGLANRITLARAVLICLAGGFLVAPQATLAPLATLAPQATVAGWWLVGLAVTALLLDGIDGRVARRRGEATAFGARLDMEIDALGILVLAALVWQADRAGAWILLAGLLRYGFVAAGVILPALARPLPPSGRRRAVCALQGGGLVFCLIPGLPGPLALVVAGATLTALLFSFAADTIFLLSATADPSLTTRRPR